MVTDKIIFVKIYNHLHMGICYERGSIIYLYSTPKCMFNACFFKNGLRKIIINKTR